jgi:hypothetical protein
MRIVRHQLLVPAGLLLVALSGCAAAPAPSAPSADPTPSSTAEPAALEPQSTLPLGCADLLSLEDVQQRIPGTSLTVAVDESSAPDGEYWAGFAPAGGLRCGWAGAGRTDGGYDQGLQLSILGDAEAAYEAWLAGPAPQVAWSEDAYGDRSHTYCAADYQNGCYGGVMVGGYWIDVSLRDAVARTADVAEQRLSELLAPVVEAIRVAGPARPAWTPPASAYAGAGLCDDPAVASGVVDGDVTIAPWSAEGAVDQLTAGFGRAGTISCTWSSGAAGRQQLVVHVFPGGAWIFSRFAADPEDAAPGYLSAAQPVTIDGADGALTAHADVVWSAMSVGGSLVVVTNLSSSEAGDLIPVLQRVADGAH